MSNIPESWLNDNHQEDSLWATSGRGSGYGSTDNRSRESTQSFQNDNLNSLENDSGAYTSIIEKIESLRKNYNKVRDFGSRIGSLKDSNELRDNITRELSAWKSAYQKAKRDIDKFPSSIDSDKKKKNRLEKDLNSAKQQFDQLNSEITKKLGIPITSKHEVKQETKKSRHDDAPPSYQYQNNNDKQSLQLLDRFENEISFNESIIREREEEAMQIESKVLDIHSSYLELNKMLNEQDPLLQEIDLNIKKTHTDITRGVENLGGAEKHDKKGRVLICLILIVVLVISLVVVLFFAVLFALKYFLK